MTAAGVQEYLAGVRPRYRVASRRRKGQLLDEICATTRLHRKSVIRRLGQPVVRAGRAQGRARRHGPEVAAALVLLWELSDRLCGRLLAPLLREALEALSRATVDRLPRRRAGPRPHRPTSTLKA
jgi:hypothetical protein